MDASVLIKTIVWWGFGLGIVFGFIANKTNFCTMGAVSDVVNMGHWGRMRAWLLEIAVAMIGTNVLAYFGYLDLSKTLYTGNNFPWLAYIVGGPVSYTHLRAHETRHDLVCRLLLEKKKKKK